MRFELMTSSLPRRRSTPELRGPFVAQADSLRSKSQSAKNLERTNPSLSDSEKLERATRLELATLSLEG
ncbi:MAG: hypothetical protein QOE77_848 [Blastocatellia bacterium]|nr:hypothetical protein [Blastocatellia bacterium]